MWNVNSILYYFSFMKGFWGIKGLKFQKMHTEYSWWQCLWLRYLQSVLVHNIYIYVLVHNAHMFRIIWLWFSTWIESHIPHMKSIHTLFHLIMHIANILYCICKYYFVNVCTSTYYSVVFNRLRVIKLERWTKLQCCSCSCSCFGRLVLHFFVNIS